MQRKRGLQLGRPFGFPLLVHRSWLGVGALLTVHIALTTFGAERFAVAVAASAAVVVVIFLSTVLHEGAHALARRSVRIDTADVTLFVFGGVARTSKEPWRPGQEWVVAIAGPLASVGIGLGCLIGSSYVPAVASDAVWLVGFANLVLAGANLLPGLPLDGGRIFAGYMWRRNGDRAAALLLASRTGKAWGLAAVLIGLWLTATSLSVPSDAALGLWFVLVGVFLISEASRAGRGAHVAGLVVDGTAGAWARPFTGRIRAETVVPGDGGPYAVSDGPRLAGILMPEALATASGKRAGEVMIPWTPDIALNWDVPITSALQRLASPGTAVLVVLDESGIVRGVIDNEGVRARLGRI